MQPAAVTPIEAILLREAHQGVVTLTLNRPAQFNALSEELLQSLRSALEDIAQDETARVVVLAAAGKAFCPGHDLKQMRANRSKAYTRGLLKLCSEVMTRLMRIPQPVIARVHGLATAAGCQLVASCDLAVAVDTARFAVSGINAGLFCSTPAVALSRNVGRKQAMEMLLTGEFISAEEALRRGLVNRVVAAERLDAEVQALAQSILSKSAAAVSLGKQMFYRQLEMGVDEAYDLASETMACNMMCDDAAEGIDAFIGKRPPQWTGR